jgi:hypothetical protein
MKTTNQIRAEQFNLLVNQLNYVDYKILSEALGVDTKTIRSDFKKFIKEYKIDLQNKIGNQFDEYFNDGNDYYYNRHKETGFCRGFSQYKTRIVNFSNEEIAEILNIENINDARKKYLKNKLKKLLTTNIYKIKSLKNTEEVIEICIEKQKCIKIQSGYYLLNKKEQSLIGKQIFPLHYDLENGILYAIVGIEEPEYSSLIMINPHAITNCEISQNDIEIDYLENYDLPHSIEDSNLFEESDKKSYLFIDILGNIKLNSVSYNLNLDLNHIAKANLLKKSITFYSYIKNNKKDSKFPFKIKMRLNDIDEISGFLFSNQEHIKIIGDSKFKEALKQKTIDFINNLKK